MTTLFPLGTGELMPAVVAGYEVTAPAPTFEEGEVPEWMFFVEQQAGGYAMSYPRLVGAVMRLEANAHHARSDPASLISCFHAMAEDPNYRLLEQRFPRMRALCGTWGEAYGSAALSALESHVSSCFALPPPSRGIEAFVALEPACGVDAVSGWKMVAATEGVAEVGKDDGRSCDDWRDGSLFDADCANLLRGFGLSVLKVSRPPSLFFIWENSD